MLSIQNQFCYLKKIFILPINIHFLPQGKQKIILVPFVLFLNEIFLNEELELQPFLKQIQPVHLWFCPLEIHIVYYL